MEERSVIHCSCAQSTSLSLNRAMLLNVMLLADVFPPHTLVGNFLGNVLSGCPKLELAMCFPCKCSLGKAWMDGAGLILGPCEILLEHKVDEELAGEKKAK